MESNKYQVTALREAIREMTAKHLDAGHLVMGQCLTAVGWVAGTVPSRNDVTELPMSDVAQSGFVVGAALMGRHPIYIVRYQGFQWFNASFIVNYAAKSKAIWKRPCPLLVRSIAMEGGIGPVNGSSQHSLFHRMPGVTVYSPMTPGEWKGAYDDFIRGDDPVYLSEHRKAYDNEGELPTISMTVPDVVLFPISVTRFAALDAASVLNASGVKVAVHHIFRLKPFQPSEGALDDLWRSRFGGIILDDDFPSGVASAIAQDLHVRTGAQVRTMGLEDRTAGFSVQTDNLPPDAGKIEGFIRDLIG